MRVYKNISSETQVLIGFGSVIAGGTIKTSEEINNPNFQLKEEKQPVVEKKETKKDIK